MMIVENAVCLGAASRSWWKKESTETICAAFFTPELGLFRIRPLGVAGFMPKRWTYYRVGIEKSPSDTRLESYRPAIPSFGGLLPAVRCGEAFVDEGKILKRADRWDVLNEFVVPGTKVMNESKNAYGRAGGLAIVLPVSTPVLYDKGGVLRIKWTTSDGVNHDTMMLSEESRLAYEDRKMKLPTMAKNLGLASAPPLLVGNYGANPTSWGVITVLNALDR